MTKDKDNNEPATPAESGKPFTEGLERELKPPAKAPTKKVKVRRLKR
jgi:hypothetical protein